MIEDRLKELLLGLGVPPCPPDAELQLTSLQVVTLVDQLERVFSLRLTSRDVTRKNFRTLASLQALVEARSPA